tara:strand:- start:740 stop:952 length:213 start_codon:yes stop_codon:yes gene_type:complete
MSYDELYLTTLILKGFVAISLFLFIVEQLVNYLNKFHYVPITIGNELEEIQKDLNNGIEINPEYFEKFSK